MTDIKKLVDLTEPLILKLKVIGVCKAKKTGMNVTDKFDISPTDEELSQLNKLVNQILQKKRPGYAAKYWRRNCWNNLERQYYQCVWLTVRKVEAEE